MDKGQTLSIIQLTTMYYPNMKIDDLPFTLEAWHQILKDYDVDTIGANLIAYVKKGEKFPPSVGELLPTKKSTIPNSAETRLMLEEKYKAKPSTPEVVKESLDKMRAMLNKAFEK